MGKHSRKANKGKDYRIWKATPAGTCTLTRQRKRAIARAVAWKESSFPRIPFDDRGLIPRKTRRDMAIKWAGRNWRRAEVPK